MLSQKVFLADKLSICPVIQQVVGIGTALTNLVKTVSHLAELIKYKKELDTEGFYGKSINTRLIENHLEIKKLKNDLFDHFKKDTTDPKFVAKTSSVNMQIYVSNFVNKKNLTDLGLIETEIDTIKKILLTEILMARELQYMGVGTVRAMPLAGTIYGIVICCKGESI